ncbi:hypothetical protein NDU88_001167 [Pleurodeles waltl]|uniref:Uncharacterized protein n=1 Tax=Pleurodeles waltl TaxID=8319 RepID=A0AAV7RA08_PLEWA|nr:hypothetical protein NDU88_001167 [Pleurodeles waltl]
MPNALQCSLAPTDDKLNRDNAAIENSWVSIENKIDSLVAELGFIRDDHHKFMDRVTEGEKPLAELQPQFTAKQHAIWNLLNRVRVLEGRAEVSKGRSHRSKIRILGLLEKTKGHDPLAFLETCIVFHLCLRLHTIFLTGSSTQGTGMSACSWGASTPDTDQAPPFQNRNANLKAARLTRTLKLENSTIMLILDYTQAVQLQRAFFLAVSVMEAAHCSRTLATKNCNKREWRVPPHPATAEHCMD